MQNTWFLDGCTGKYIQFLKPWYGLFSHIFREADTFQIQGIFKVEKGHTGIFQLCDAFIPGYSWWHYLNWHCHGFSCQSLQKHLPILRKARKWLLVPHKPFESKNSVTGLINGDPVTLRNPVSSFQSAAPTNITNNVSNCQIKSTRPACRNHLPALELECAMVLWLQRC